MRRTPFIISATIAAVSAVCLAFSVDLIQAVGHADSFSDRTLEAFAVAEPHPFNVSTLAKGKFLVASRTLVDPRFMETVVLLISYDSTGAAGLIINRPTKMPLAKVLPSVEGLKKRSDVLYYGGPVENQQMLMLIRSDEKVEGSDNVFKNVYVSISAKTLDRMIRARKTQKQLRVYSGYAGWIPDQLDKEVSHGDWFIIDADADFIFEKKSSDIWLELIGRGSAIEVWRCNKDERSSS
jgi:putative AlgH/UPF0301 family transcriptional regulator